MCNACLVVFGEYLILPYRDLNFLIMTLTPEIIMYLLIFELLIDLSLVVLDTLLELVDVEHFYLVYKITQLL